MCGLVYAATRHRAAGAPVKDGDSAVREEVVLDVIQCGSHC
jgi:hypothetical protein